uniref:NADH-ubiquinone oxidoreductase chain 3 n=1 Tax=Elateroidea sp. 10 KM-2017 TaxID=2219424 RepID=A0A346RGZ8_9COLE|nr:NADH dehydrogenase subunit 3 [Elateroidea sp. 10 KM-2017]
MLILMSGMFIFLVSLLMMKISMVISKKTVLDREKSSPFECGFDPNSSARLPFSLHFFLIAMIFLIFDVEITLLLPMIYIIKLTNFSTMLLMFSIFIMILLAGLYHEWKQGALTWTI